jgi:hypothetical protein
VSYSAGRHPSSGRWTRCAICLWTRFWYASRTNNNDKHAYAGQLNSFTHLRALMVLPDILGSSQLASHFPVLGEHFNNAFNMRHLLLRRIRYYKVTYTHIRCVSVHHVHLHSYVSHRTRRFYMTCFHSQMTSHKQIVVVYTTPQILSNRFLHKNHYFIFRQIEGGGGKVTYWAGCVSNSHSHPS